MTLIIAFSQTVDIFTRFLSVTQEGKHEALYRNLRTGVYGICGTDLGLN